MPGSEKAERPRGEGAADGPAEMFHPRLKRTASNLAPARLHFVCPVFRASSRTLRLNKDRLEAAARCHQPKRDPDGRRGNTRGPGEKGKPLPFDRTGRFYLGLSARKMQALRSTGGGPPSGGIVVTSAIISTISTTGRERPGTARAMPDCPGEAPQRRPGGPGPASMVLAALRRPASAAALLAALALAGTLVAPPRPLLFWNASPSSRTGLYAISKGGPARGDTAGVGAGESSAARCVAPLSPGNRAAGEARRCGCRGPGVRRRKQDPGQRPSGREAAGARSFRPHAAVVVGLPGPAAWRAVPALARLAGCFRRPLFRNHAQWRGDRQGEAAVEGATGLQ